MFQATFDIEARHCYATMKKIGKQWRDFKTRRTREIYECVNQNIDPESIATDQENKYGIPRDDWIRFVNYRISSEFAVSVYC